MVIRVCEAGGVQQELASLAAKPAMAPQPHVAKMLRERRARAAIDAPPHASILDRLQTIAGSGLYSVAFYLMFT